MNMISAEQEGISIKQFATCLGISYAHAYRLVKNGEVPAVMLGSRYIISKAFLLEALKVESLK